MSVLRMLWGSTCSVRAAVRCAGPLWWDPRQLRRTLCSAVEAGQAALRKEVLQVQPNYGTLFIKGNINFTILADTEHLGGSTCQVRLLAPTSSTSSSTSSTYSNEGSLASTAFFKVLQSPDGSHLTVEASVMDEGGGGHLLPLCEVIVPPKYDVQAALTGEGGVHVDALQNSCTEVHTAHGGCTVHRLQCTALRYTTARGDLHIKGKLTGSLYAEGEQLTVRGDAVQAGSVQLCSSAAPLSLQLHSLHAEHVSVQADEAVVRVGNVTAHSVMAVGKATVDVGNCSGAISWRFTEADVRVGVPQLNKDSNITVTRGRCSVACPAEYRYGISCRADTVTVRPGFEDLTQRVVVDAGAGEQQTGRTEQTEVTAGLEKPLLKVTVQEGPLTLVPWSWPFTKH